MSSVELVPHDPAWAAAYELERARIAAALGDRLVEIEHVGSTSLAGVAAKPTIDIALTVRDLGETPAIVAALEALGYEYVPAFEAALPNRRHLRSHATGPTGERLFHLHIYQHRHREFVEYLVFREFLRAHPDVAADYVALKRRLGETVARDHYANAKEDFVRDVLARAGSPRA